MTTDKSWTTLRDRNDPVFIEGIQKFIEIAKDHLDTDGKAYCPCRKCVNSKRHIPSYISAHIRDYGFLQSYDTWVHHGEEYPNSSDLDALFASKKRTSVTDNEMFDAINDVLAEQNTYDENIEDEDGTHLDSEFDALFAEEKIIRESTRMQEEAGEVPIDEQECLTRVLGPRRGWTRGIGRKVRKVGPDVSCVVISPSQAEHDELKEHVRLLTQNVQDLTSKVQRLENQGSSQQDQEEDEDEDEDENDF